MDVSDASDSRLTDLTQWVRGDLGFTDCVIAPASADASFRRYFRVTRDANSYIVMDAPPDKEDSGPFLKVAKTMAGMGLNVPLVLARDLKRGLLLMSDLGSRQYLDELTSKAAADVLYGDALRALQTMQLADADVSRQLPRYDRAFLRQELDLMPAWFLDRHLGVNVDGAQRALLNQLFEILLQSAESQPATFVHRDYHSRNLLCDSDNNPGILDFQDAMWGPITYDLASLLKDCYIAWPAADVRAWALQYRQQLLAAGFPLAADAGQFLRWFDLIGLQRHIKVLGVFSRLFYRDGKSQYLHDLPRVLKYAKEAAAAYPETAPFAAFIDKHIEPQFRDAQRRALA